MPEITPEGISEIMKDPPKKESIDAPFKIPT